MTIYAPHPPSITVVLAADPGSTTGICHLQISKPCDGSAFVSSTLVFGCNPIAVFPLMQFLLEINEGPARIVAAYEKFVPGRGAGSVGKGARDARMVIGELEALPVTWHSHPAVEVKQWATDTRLKAAGLFECTAKMVDARDAARHALFAAVRYAGLADPLSRAARAARVPRNLDGMDN